MNCAADVYPLLSRQCPTSSSNRVYSPFEVVNDSFHLADGLYETLTRAFSLFLSSKCETSQKGGERENLLRHIVCTTRYNQWAPSDAGCWERLRVAYVKKGGWIYRMKSRGRKKRLYSHHISINCCWQTGKKYKRSLPISKESFGGFYGCWLLYIRVSLTLLDITKYQTIFFAWKLRGYVSNIYRRVSLLFHGRLEN
jgi:hypothetical protein